MLLHTLREQRGDAASAGYGRTGGMSSSRCKCSWPRMITTPPHGDRAGPGAEGGGTRCTARPRSGCASPPQGSRPPCLAEPRGPQDQDQLRTMEQAAAYAPTVQILDIPVPQMVEQLPDVLRIFATLLPVPEQVIEVPKIPPEDVPFRAVLRDPQLAEQLVEVPTIISYSSLQLNMEQNVDIPVPCRGGRNPGLQALLSRQSSTASQLSLERISERIAEQIVDFPVSRGGLQDFRPGQGSSSSLHVPARDQEGLDEPGEGGFSTFPKI